MVIIERIRPGKTRPQGWPRHYRASSDPGFLRGRMQLHHLVEAMGTEDRLKLLQRKAVDISKWMAQRPERKDILKTYVDSFARAQDVFQRALAAALNRARKVSRLQNRQDKPGSKWQWVFLQDDQVAALDKKNVNSDGLVHVPRGVCAIGFWAKSLPFDPLGWMRHYYGPDVSHGVRGEPQCADSIPRQPGVSEESLMCKCGLVAVIYDKAYDRCAAERLTPAGPLDWPEQAWMAVSFHEPTYLDTADYKMKTGRILQAWEDVKTEIGRYEDQQGGQPSEMAESGRERRWPILSWLRSWLWKLYETTIKAFFSAFWDRVNKP